MLDTFFHLFALFCPIKGVTFWLFLGNCKVADQFSHLYSNPISNFYTKIELKTRSQQGTAGLKQTCKKIFSKCWMFSISNLVYLIYFDIIFNYFQLIPSCRVPCSDCQFIDDAPTLTLHEWLTNDCITSPCPILRRWFLSNVYSVNLLYFQ